MRALKSKIRFATKKLSVKWNPQMGIWAGAPQWRISGWSGNPGRQSFSRGKKFTFWIRMSFCLIWSGINDGDFFVFQIFVWCARCAAGKLFSIVLSINEINFCARYWDYWGGKLLTRKTGKGGGRNAERYFFARYGAVLYFLSCAPTTLCARQ